MGEQHGWAACVSGAMDGVVHGTVTRFGISEMVPVIFKNQRPSVDVNHPQL